MSEVRHSFKHSFSHLNQKGANDYLIEQSGIKKYSEWQNPPITYYGPSANNKEAKLTYMYSFKGTVKEAKLKLRLWAWNWGRNTFGEGSAWVSKDGKDWIKILSRDNPISGGKTSLFHESLPNEVLGSNELFLQIRLNVYNSSVGSYTNSQFGRADSNSKEEIFSIDVEYATIECKDISIPDPKPDGRKGKKDLNIGLIAWYPLDGNASDMSGNSRHGTIYGSNPTEDRHGKMNGAYNFDGKDDYIKINHDKAFNHLPLSISVWFKSNETQHGSIVSKYWNGSWNGWTVNVNSSEITPFYLRSRGKQVIGNHHPSYRENKGFGSTYERNSWNHVVLVYSNEGGKIYLEGKLKDTKNWKGEAGSPSTTQPVNIGLYRRSKSGGSFFKGSIDDVRIYDRALSEVDVLALYELESTDPNDGRPTPPPLPGTGGLTPPDPDYKDTIAELKRLLAEKDKKIGSLRNGNGCKEQTNWQPYLRKRKASGGSKIPKRESNRTGKASCLTHNRQRGTEGTD
jgi:hypothetical protein